MARDEPTEDIVRREIRRARQILREDKVLKAHSELMTHLAPKDPPVNDGNPPAPEPIPPKDPPRKRSVWWGEES